MNLTKANQFVCEEIYTFIEYITTSLISLIGISNLPILFTSEYTR
jgi:hypothetical protein